MDVDIVVHDATKGIFVLDSDGHVEQVASDSITNIEKLNSRKTLYLFDPAETATKVHIPDAFTVMSTRPGQKYSLTDRKFQKMQVRLLFPWTLKEARAALQALQPQKKLSKKQDATLEKRFDEVGGSVRWLLAKQDEYEREVKAVFKSTTVVTVKEIQSWMKIVEENVGPTGTDSTSKIPHLFIHCVAPEVDPHTPYRFMFGFASSLSESIIFNTVKLNSDDEWRTFVRETMKICTARK